jgi:hypothetical protein
MFNSKTGFLSLSFARLPFFGPVPPEPIFVGMKHFDDIPKS